MYGVTYTSIPSITLRAQAKIPIPDIGFGEAITIKHASKISTMSPVRNGHLGKLVFGFSDMNLRLFCCSKLLELISIV